MSINHLLDIGRSALQSAQFGLDVTANNIANVNTPGYSRQRAVQAPRESVSMGGNFYGAGVSIESVERVYDAFLGHQVYKANAEMMDYQMREHTYMRIESILYPSEDTNLGSLMDEFFSAWQDLANNPAGSAERQMVLTKAEELAHNLRSLHGSLEEEIQYTNTLLEGYADEVNRLASEIALINQEVARLEGMASPPNDLLDRRDALIQELSGYLDPTVIEEEGGRLTVLVSGGQPLVQGNTSFTLDLAEDPDNHGFYRLSVRGTDITDSLRGGKLRGVVETREKMVEFQDALNRLAADLVREFNQLHTAGYDLDGNPGQEFFTPVDPSATPDMAREIQVNIRDGDRIAAAQDPDALPGDNRNALAMAGLRDATVVDGGSTTFGGFYQSLVGRVGADVQDAARKAEAGEAVYESMTDYKNSVSGVSLEEEQIRLLAYQHAYQAAAKFLTVVEDLMDTLLAI